MRGLMSTELRKATVFACLGALALGVAAASGCGADSSGGAPAPVAQEVTKKSMQATGDFYKQQHAKKK